MDRFSKEVNIISNFQDESIPFVLFPVVNREVRLIFSSIYKRKNWKYWIDTSGKNDPPPDFYNIDLKLMMDVMRVDDHEYISAKGKVVNEERRLENEAFAELKRQGMLDKFDPANIYVDIHSDLPTDEDHNFTRYIECFKRTIENHKRKIENYKKNHPGYKVIFFVFDESSAYCEVADEKKVNIKKGELMRGRPHIHFLDNQFLKVIDGSEIDYLIWYAPYKKINLGGDKIYDMPRAAIYDSSNMKFECIEYNNKRLISVEV